MLRTKILILGFLAFTVHLLIPVLLPVDALCEDCNTTTGFACVSRTQFVKCNASSLDFTKLGVCPSGSVCNETETMLPFVNLPCFENITGSNLTYLTSCKRPVQNFITGASTTFVANTFCASRPTGLFPHPTITNCTYYVRCFSNNSVIEGRAYKCPGPSRFNNATLLCDSTGSC